MKHPTFFLLFAALTLLVPAFEVHAATLHSDARPFVPSRSEFASAIVVLPRSKQTLYALEPDAVRSAASLTKLVNAIALVRSNPSWDKIVSILRADEVGGGRLRVNVGARLSLRDALYSSITGSANNAANTLARVSKWGKTLFIKQMNTEAKRLNLTQSHFVDPAGMDPRNVTTAREMAVIADEAFRQPIIRSAATSPTYQFTIRNTGVKKSIANTNHLLTRDPDVWVMGGKTGYLEESQYNLAVALRPLDAYGKSVASKEVTIVVLGAPTKEGSFAAAKRLAEWAWDNHEF